MCAGNRYASVHDRTAVPFQSDSIISAIPPPCSGTTGESGERLPSGPHTVLLVGSGAIHGSWDPIVEAVQTEFSQVSHPDQANTVLGNVVSNLRFWYHAQAQELESEGAIRASTQATFSMWCTTRERLSIAIAGALMRAEASPMYTLRDQFEAVWDLSMRAAGPVQIVTTNWDRLISNRLRARWPGMENSVFHVHGDRRDPATLLLPAEAAFDPYRKQDSRRFVQARRRAITQALERAERLFLYGVSLSPDNVELAHALASGLDESQVQHVEIIDPRPERAARRLMALLRRRRPSLTGRTPDQLAPPASYAWRPCVVG